MRTNILQPPVNLHVFGWSEEVGGNPPHTEELQPAGRFEHESLHFVRCQW